MLNSKQVNQIFRQNAILIGNADGVPEYRAVELFGEEAVDYVMGTKGRNGYYNGYGIGDYNLFYLTYSGFQAVATYANVIEVRELCKAVQP